VWTSQLDFVRVMPDGSAGGDAFRIDLTAPLRSFPSRFSHVVITL